MSPVSSDTVSHTFIVSAISGSLWVGATRVFLMSAPSRNLRDEGRKKG